MNQWCQASLLPLTLTGWIIQTCMVLLSVLILYIHLSCTTVNVENSPSTMIITTARSLNPSWIFRSRHSTGEGLLSKEILCKVKLAVLPGDSSDTLNPGWFFKPTVLDFNVEPVTFKLHNRSPPGLVQVNVTFPLTGTTYVLGRDIGWASVVRMTEGKDKDTHCLFIACKCKTITLTFTVRYSNIWSVCHYCHHWEGTETEQAAHFTCRYTMHTMKWLITLYILILCKVMYSLIWVLIAVQSLYHLHSVNLAHVHCQW